MLIENLKIREWDSRRNIIIPGDPASTLIFCVEHFINLSKLAIKDHDAFFVALSGGSTPKALFETLTSSPYKEIMQWNKCHFFWSDERSVSPDDPESNYHMAMHAGLNKIGLREDQIHRMRAETEIEKQSLAYEQEIAAYLKGRPFDLVMLGMGEDGHTASLFPGTEGLHVENRLVIANFIPQKNTWRMTFTYPCINNASHIAIYVLGASKKKIVAEVLCSSSGIYPIEKIGTPSHKALWIVDEAASEEISFNRKT